MFQNSIISEELSIYKFFKQLNLDLYLTKPQLQHLESVMKAMISTGYKNVSIILSYPKDSFHDKGTLKAFISLDKSLTSLEILNQYSDRWAIEPFFRDCKSYLGLNGYQVRSEKSITRYLTIMIINYTYCKLCSKDLHHFSTGYKLAKNDLQKSKIIYIYEAAANGTSLDEIFLHFKIA